MKKLWFRRKLYGWGWYPVTWQGWLVTLGYVFLILFFFLRIDENSHSASDTLIGAFLPFVCLTFLMIFICYKTGEKPKWQWGPEDKKIPKVGVGVMILKDGQVLMGKRKNKHGDGEYAWPGGHLEYMESIIECVKREVFEECGLKVKNIRFLRLLNMKEYNKHYVDIAMVCDWESGEPENKEPKKCEGWAWYDKENLPEPLFAPIKSYFDAIKTGKNFYDTI